MLTGNEQCTLALQGYELAIHRLIESGLQTENLHFFYDKSLSELNHHKEDGIYVFYHAPCNTLISEAELHMRNNLDKILQYVSDNFDCYDVNDILNDVYNHEAQIRKNMHFDVVIAVLRNGKLDKYLTFEIAGKEHWDVYNPKFSSKAISDALKSHSKRGKTIILHCDKYIPYQINFANHLKNNGINFI